MRVEIDKFNEVWNFLSEKLVKSGLSKMDAESVLVVFENFIQQKIYKEIQYDYIDKIRFVEIRNKSFLSTFNNLVNKGELK